MEQIKKFLHGKGFALVLAACLLAAAAAGVRAKTIRPDTPVSSRCTTPTKASGVSQCCRRAAGTPSSLDSPAGLSSTTRALSSYRMFTACPRSAGLSVSGCRQWSCRP